MEENVVYTIQDELGASRVAHSKGEEEWLAFYAHQHNVHVHSLYNTEKPIAYGNIIPDGTVYEGAGETARVKHLLFFMGCLWHSCECQVEQLNQKAKSVNTFGIPHYVARERFKRQCQELRDRYKIQPWQLKIMKECHWNRLKDPTNLKQSLARQVQEFLTTFRHRPDRMKVRDAYRGGRTEALHLCFNKLKTPEHVCLYLDINSLYPGIAVTRDDNMKFPVGLPRHMINPDELSRISFENDVAYWQPGANEERIPIKGVIQVSYLAPRTMMYPFLSTRVKVGSGQDYRSVAALCRTCAISGSSKPCNHPDSLRVFTDTITLDELAYAVTSLQYEVVEIHECLAYTQFSHLFRRFLNVLARDKICADALPSSWSDERKQQEVDAINEGMGFEGVEKLAVHDFRHSPTQRLVCKLSSNALLGTCIYYFLRCCTSRLEYDILSVYTLLLRCCTY